MNKSVYISEDFSYGPELSLGFGTIIEANVLVGNNVKIGHRVTLKSGTVIGNDSIIDDHCITTGACYIGNNVNIRTGAIISRATIIEDCCFIGPGVITNHTKNVTHGRPQTTKNTLLTYISYGSIIGSQCSILAGIYIAPQVIIGGGTVVVKSIYENGVYVGSPAKKISELPNQLLMQEPNDAGKMYLNRNIAQHLDYFNPGLNMTFQFESIVNF